MQLGFREESYATDVNRIVVGLGATGLSVMRFLQRNGLAFSAYDQVKPNAQSPFWQDVDGLVNENQLGFGSSGLDLLQAADVIYLSPGIAIDAVWLLDNIKASTKISGDLDLFAQAVDANVIAITGSNGKSTVTTLVGEMAKKNKVTAAVGGNLGTPMLDLLADEIDLYVLELSSFQLERSLGLNDHIACFLNLSPDHLDRHGTMQAYAEVKQRIYHRAKAIVYNTDDQQTKPLNSVNAQSVSFGLEALNQHQIGIELVDQKRYAAFNGKKLFATDEVPLLGEHNVLNAMAAFALGSLAGLTDTAMQQAIRDFSGLAHRGELVATINGVKFVNDSKATNTGAALAALHGLDSLVEDGRILLIAGGVTKGAKFDELADYCASKQISLILMGEAAESIAKAINGRCSHAYANSIEEAVSLAMHEASAGDLVLLAPACASFDMFDNYMQRGDSFKFAVKHYQEKTRIAGQDKALMTNEGGRYA